MAQQVIPAAQIVPKYHLIGRCKNYAVLQSIPCSPECKIVGQILLDHPLSYALTATTDVPVVYLQQFLRTVSKVPGPEETIKFMLITQQFVYTMDMFRDILYFPVETPDNPFVAPVTIETIEAFMNNWLSRIKKDYHSIKDDIPLVSVYIIGDARVRGMLILDMFLTAKIRATADFKEYEMVFMTVDVPMNQPITKVVRIIIDQPHGLDFIEQILVIKENDKPDSFSEADFKYLNKNDIEDLYYLCRNKKVNYRETNLMNSLITFIRSCVIWERVHDFQLRIKSYQIKVNLTAPTLTFPGIEACEPYSIVDKPNTGLIYLNNKGKKRLMCLVEIMKFCDATLEKVLKEVKLKIFQL
ncbi:hypothetical protein Tco_0512200 [Tanacetum coccineum]